MIRAASRAEAKRRTWKMYKSKREEKGKMWSTTTRALGRWGMATCWWWCEMKWKRWLQWGKMKKKMLTEIFALVIITNWMKNWQSFDCIVTAGWAVNSTDCAQSIVWIIICWGLKTHGCENDANVTQKKNEHWAPQQLDSCALNQALLFSPFSRIQRVRCVKKLLFFSFSCSVAFSKRVMILMSLHILRVIVILFETMKWNRKKKERKLASKSTSWQSDSGRFCRASEHFNSFSCICWAFQHPLALSSSSTSCWYKYMECCSPPYSLTAPFHQPNRPKWIIKIKVWAA